MNAFEQAAARREERREEKRRQDLLASASRFTSSAQISDEELAGIRRWEGSAAAADAVAASKERGRYTPVTKVAPRAVAAAQTTGAAPAAAGQRNTLSTLALVAAALTGVGGIVLGIIALGQIRRTGEAGHGNARSAIILGCLWIFTFVVYSIAAPYMG